MTEAATRTTLCSSGTLNSANQPSSASRRSAITSHPSLHLFSTLSQSGHPRVVSARAGTGVRRPASLPRFVQARTENVESCRPPSGLHQPHTPAPRGRATNRDRGSVTRNVGCPDGMDSPFRRRLVRDGLRHAPDAQPRAHTAVAAAGCAASAMISFSLLTVAPRDLLVGPACAAAETGEWRDGRNGARG
jgi:hypothetical protein